MNGIEDILEQALESIARGEKTPEDWKRQYPEIADELAEALEAGLLLRGLPKPEISDAFRVELRAKVMREFSKPAPSRVAFFRRPAFVLAAATIIFLFVTGVVMAQNTRNPKSLLYPVKRVIEKIKETVMPGQDNKARAQLDSASERLEELKTVIDENPELAEEQAEDFDKAVGQAEESIKLLPPDESEALQKEAVELKDERDTLLENREAGEPDEEVEDAEEDESDDEIEEPDGTEEIESDDEPDDEIDDIETDSIDDDDEEQLIPDAEIDD